MSLSSLPLARYRLDLTVATPLTLPAFSGSSLRGAFGTALRSSACITKAKNCDGCPLLASCPYAMVFEPRPPSPTHPLQDFNQIPRPYIVEPPEWGEKTYTPGETISFHLVLAGRALEQLHLIFLAFHRGFQRGVGKGNGTASLMRVWHVDSDQDELILDGPEASIKAHEATITPIPTYSKTAITLLFNSPMRLQTNGRRATADEFTPRKLLTTLIRRISLIHEFHGGGPLPLDFKLLASQAEALGSEKELKWRDWTRYSSRQKQKMDLGGVIGSWKLSGDIEPFLPFLHIGQWLHVGKEATFGLGNYRLHPA